MFIDNWAVAGSLTGTMLAQGGVLATALPTPTGLVGGVGNGSGNIPPGTYFYRLSAFNTLGETLACPEISYVAPAPVANVIRLTWTPVLGATGYKLYGRTTGAEQLLATINGGANGSFLDFDITVVPSGPLPTANTTGIGVFAAGVQLATVGALPTPSAINRGQLWVLQGGAGVTDQLYLAVKNSADAYSWISMERLITTEALTYFVDPVGGLDTNDGKTALTAFQTLPKAISVLPYILAHTVQVNCAAGTYPALLNIHHVLLSTGKLNITGTAWTNFTPATGAGSGTFDAVFAEPLANTAKFTGAGWTVNNLKGKFLQITSGALTGRFIPIGANTADTLDISAAANTGTYNLQSVSFVIVEQAATLARDPSQTQAIMWVTNDPTDFTAANGITLENFKVDLTGLTNSGIRPQHGVMQVRQCMTFTSSGAPTALFPSGRDVRLTVTDTYLSAGAGSFVLSAANTSQTTLDGVIIDGGAVGLSATTTATVTTSIGQCLIQNCTTAGLSLTQSFMTGGRGVIRACAVGLRVFGQCRITPSSLVVINNTANGVHLQNGGGASDLGSTVQMTGWTVTGNTLAGVAVDSSHNWIYLSTTTVSSNGTWGVNSANLKGGAFNQVSTTSATTMAGNTSGDFSIDNVAAISLASLRADGDKDILDPVRLNRLFEF